MLSLPVFMSLLGQTALTTHCNDDNNNRTIQNHVSHNKWADAPTPFRIWLLKNCIGFLWLELLFENPEKV